MLDNYRALVIAHGNHAIEFKDFFNTPLSVCIERDKTEIYKLQKELLEVFIIIIRINTL